MTDETNLHPILCRLRNHKDLLASVAYLLAIAGALGTFLVSAISFIGEHKTHVKYSVQLVAALVFLCTALLIAVIWRTLLRYPFHRWAAYFLLLVPLALLVSYNMSFGCIFIIRDLYIDDKYRPFLGLDLAIYVIIVLLHAVLAIAFAIWFVRFYWDTNVRLAVIERALQDSGVNVSDMRAKWCSANDWTQYGTVTLTLMRVAAPTDLAYTDTKDRPPSGPPAHDRCSRVLRSY